MSNAAKFETPDSADNGKTYVYNSGTDAHVLTDMASQAELDAHTADTTDAHDASAISFVAGGTIAGTDVQTAVAEVATDAATALSTHEADTTAVHGITNTATLISATLVDAKGDLIVGTAADTVTRLAVGTNTHVLTADSAEASGVKWAAAAGGGSSDPLAADFIISGRMFGR